MSRAAWWLAEKVSLALRPAERAAVRGDLEESRESGWQALREIAGLVARRAWRRWYPTALATLLGLAVVHKLAGFIRLSSVYLWMYAANWRADDTGNPAFWNLLGREAARFLLPGAVAMLGGIAAGAILGRGRGRAGAAVFCAALTLANLANVPRAASFLPAAIWTAYAFAVLGALVIWPAIGAMRFMRHRLP